MLFADKLYRIQQPEQSATGVISATLPLQAEHPIFQGHFPQQPVLPGVCLVQAVGEVLTVVLGRPCRLSTASNIKFTNVIDPRVHPSIQLTIQTKFPTPQLVEVQAEASRNGENCLKLKATFSFC